MIIKDSDCICQMKIGHPLVTEHSKKCKEYQNLRELKETFSRHREEDVSKHAGKMLQYQRDMLHHEKPWEFWRVKTDDEWHVCEEKDMYFNKEWDYRRTHP